LIPEAGITILEIKAYQKVHGQDYYFPGIRISAKADPHQYSIQRVSQDFYALEQILFLSHLKIHDFLGLTSKTVF
jgi:hypothetical protein